MKENIGPYLARIFNRFSYLQKFILIGLFFTASLVTTTYLMIKAQDQRLDNAQDELRGIEYVNLVKKLMSEIPKHQLLADRYLRGNNTLKMDINNLQAQIRYDFDDLVTYDRQVEDEMYTKSSDFQLRGQPNLKPSDLERKWNDLINQFSELTPAENKDLHNRLIMDLQALLSYVAVTSQLFAEDKMGSMILIDNVIKELPNEQEKIIQITELGDNALTAKSISPEDKSNLSYLFKALQKNSLSSKLIIEQSYIEAKNFENDPEIELKIKDPLYQYIENIRELLSYVDTYILTPVAAAAPSKETPGTPTPLSLAKDNGSSSDLYALGMKAFNSSFILWDASMDQAKRRIQNEISHQKSIQWYSIIFSFGSIIVGFLLGLYVLSGISRPLEELIKATRQFAQGDLSTRLPISHYDEIGQVSLAFNQMAESFQELIGQLQWAGIQLTTSSTQIASAAKQQEATIIEQESTTKQIAVTAREISATAKDFAKTMNEVSSTAEQTSSLAASGKAGLAQMEGIMRQMVEASANIASKLAILNEKAGSITGIISTISKVADQTNLLSLNAAIEAEKAGEHGRSFSVIAREIRRLADQTANATLDIEKMVNEMVSAVSAGVMGVDKFSEEIHTGVSQVSTVSEQLTKIIEQVQQQTTSFENVNQGMQAQSLGAEQINDSINQLSEAAQQTSESIHQFHKAIEQLNNAAKEMQSAVSKIKR